MISGGTADQVLGPGEGVHYSARGSEMAFKAVAAQTGGDFSLMERTVPPRGRAPQPHRHGNCSEGFYVLDGELTVHLSGVPLTVPAGHFVLAPRDALHTFGNDTGRPARLLIIHAPAMDAYFAELHALWAAGEPPTPERERELMSRFGMYRD